MFLYICQDSDDSDNSGGSFCSCCDLSFVLFGGGGCYFFFAVLKIIIYSLVSIVPVHFSLSLRLFFLDASVVLDQCNNVQHHLTSCRRFSFPLSYLN